MRSDVIHARVEGVGRPMALVHELGGSLDSFELLAPRLTDRFTVLRYDQPGCGASPPCGARVTLAGEAERLLELISMAFGNEPCRVVAVAAGAAIAVTAARKHPCAIAAMALCAPALDVPAHRRSYLLTRAARAEANGMAAIAETSLERSYPAEVRRDAAAFERYRARFLAIDATSYAAANRSLADAQILEELPDLRLPCLFLAGHHDGLRPPHEVEKLSRIVPGAAYAMVESGHIMPMQAPAQMAEHLRGFFRRTPKTMPEMRHG